MSTLNTVLISIIILIAAVLLYFKFTEKRSMERKEDGESLKYSLDEIKKYVLETLYNFTNSNLDDLNLTDEEYLRLKNNRIELKSALKGCPYGDINDKTYVKTFMYDLIQKAYKFNEENINLVLPFDERNKLTDQDKFEILLYQYKKKYGFEALSNLIQKHDLDRLRNIIEDGQTQSYIITASDIDKIFRQEVRKISLEDKLQIIVQRLYQEMKGFGPIDEIRDMNIDGVSGGVSGLPSSFSHLVGEYDHYLQQMKVSDVPYAHDSIWIFFKGKSIHLSNLSFGSELELKRVCQTIYKYNNPGQLSEANGFKVNEMKDGSRVVVLRPPFAETWAFFVRKFDVPNATLEQLIKDENSEIPIDLMKYLVKGSRVTAITGSQGTGKTTLLMALVKYIYGWHTLRVQEMRFELHLRKIYLDRNIVSLSETDHVSGQEGLDIQKKTDGSVNILGEVATDPVAAWMIQMAQVASLFTIFTHHAKTFTDLVLSLRNSLLKTRVFSNEKTAEEQVVNVLNFEIHLNRDFDGKRYIERITECIPLNEENPYSEDYNDAEGFEQKLTKFFRDAREFFIRLTDRKQFDHKNIVEFKDGRYVAIHDISEKSKKEMIQHMTPSDVEAFQLFLLKYWGEQECKQS